MLPGEKSNGDYIFNKTLSQEGVMKKIILIGFMLSMLFSQLSYAQNVHVLVNIWDGTEWERVKKFYDQGLLPNLNAVGQLHHLTCNEDCFGDKCTMTATTPQHAIMFTGCLADVHGIFLFNDHYLIPDNITVQELIKINNPSVLTAQFSGKKRNFGHSIFGNAMDEIDFYMHSKLINATLHELTVKKLLEMWKDNSYFIILHSRNPDEMGHGYGVYSHYYSDSLKQNDKILGRILDTMKKYENGAQTFVYVLSDHGFGCPTEGGHRCSPNTFITSNNPNLTGDPYMKNVANYFLSHFGLSSVCK